MKIPVFHDDQHGTAITVGAAVLAVPLSLGIDFPSPSLQSYLATWALLLSAG